MTETLAERRFLARLTRGLERMEAQAVLQALRPEPYRAGLEVAKVLARPWQYENQTSFVFALDVACVELSQAHQLPPFDAERCPWLR